MLANWHSIFFLLSTEETLNLLSWWKISYGRESHDCKVEPPDGRCVDLFPEINFPNYAIQCINTSYKNGTKEFFDKKSREQDKSRVEQESSNYYFDAFTSFFSCHDFEHWPRIKKQISFWDLWSEVLGERECNRENGHFCYLAHLIYYCIVLIRNCKRRLPEIIVAVVYCGAQGWDVADKGGVVQGQDVVPVISPSAQENKRDVTTLSLWVEVFQFGCLILILK